MATTTGTAWFRLVGVGLPFDAQGVVIHVDSPMGGLTGEYGLRRALGRYLEQNDSEFGNIVELKPGDYLKDDNWDTSLLVVFPETLLDRDVTKDVRSAIGHISDEAREHGRVVFEELSRPSA